MTDKIIEWLEEEDHFMIAVAFVIIYGLINLFIALG